VVSVRTNLDSDGLHVSDEIKKGAELFVPEDAEVKDFYAAQAFEREIVAASSASTWPRS
jgi:hypothetical protein